MFLEERPDTPRPTPALGLRPQQPRLLFAPEEVHRPAEVGDHERGDDGARHQGEIYNIIFHSEVLKLSCAQ